MFGRLKSTFVVLPRMRNRTFVYWICQVTCWGLFSLGNVLMAVILGEATSLRFFFISAGVVVLGISVTHIYRYFIHRWRWKEKTIPSLLWRMPLAALACGLILTILQFTVFDLANGRMPLFEQFSIRKFFETDIAFSVLILIWNFIYFTIAQFENYKREEIKNLELLAAKTEIELNSIKAQMNPHFMFNSMNSIRALVDENPDKAKGAITMLSGILRNNLSLGKNQVVPMRDELDLIDKYLSLEKIRFEERLHVEYRIDPATLGCEIPPFMVQTIVENAVKHGISRLKDGGTIVLQTTLNNDESFTIRVSNTGTWSNQNTGTQIGLANTHKRLDLIYRNRASFSIGAEGENIVAVLKIPISSKNENENTAR